MKTKTETQEFEILETDLLLKISYTYSVRPEPRTDTLEHQNQVIENEFDVTIDYVKISECFVQLTPILEMKFRKTIENYLSENYEG